MAFHSTTFAVFFVIVYTAYLLLRGRYKYQNAILLVASYVFYGYWDWRFLSLLLLSTVVDYYVSHGIARAAGVGRRRLLLISLVCNLGLLGFFKYWDFFIDSAAAWLELIGLHPGLPALRVILPVGISFYTFQTLSYTIDVYRGDLEPCDSLLDFALYVSFFPQLVAGPIERAVNLLPQFCKPRTMTVDQVNAGLYLLLWGYFKKLVIADNMAQLANPIFADPGAFGGADLVLATIAFAFQIYGDFSAYSDIARGLAKLMGFELMVNFRLPYLAYSPSDFWQRWHISLSTWLRDYLYIPLGGNRHGRGQTYRNLALTMLLGGLWHGAAWTFVFWGAYHGLLLVGYRLLEERGFLRHRPTGWRAAVATAIMFVFTLLGWVFFRAESIGDAFTILGHAGCGITAGTADLAYKLVWYLAPLLLLEWYQHLESDLLAVLRWNPWLRGGLYTFLLYWLFIFGARQPVEFIYFQF